MPTKAKTLFFTLLLFAQSFASLAQSQMQFDTIRIPYTDSPIEIDGKLADWSNYFITTFSDTASQIYTTGNYSLCDVYPAGFCEDKIKVPLSHNNVAAMLCWDENALYIAMYVIDKHLIAEFSGTDDNPNIYLNDAIEFYIDTKNDSKERMDVNDYQIIIDALNQHCVFKGNLRQMEYDSMFVPKERGQNLLIQSAVSYQGTFNDNKLDDYYLVEMKIPFAAIGMIPQEGMAIRIDICNDDADFLLSELGVKSEDMYITWPFNWSGLGDFGFPKTWKTAVLEGHPSLYKQVSEKFKYQWLYFLSIFVLVVAIILVLVIRHNRKLRKMPKQEILKKYVIVTNDDKSNDSSNANNNLVTKVTDYIVKNISDKITPADLAEWLHISLRTLQRLTKDELDCTPGILINMIKLQLAKDFLRYKHGNISEAAYNNGFSDPAYFSKLFKKQFGVTPKEFIDQCTEKQ
jgi:AraC-like DNA-binding protein